MGPFPNRSESSVGLSRIRSRVQARVGHCRPRVQPMPDDLLQIIAKKGHGLMPKKQSPSLAT